ncbi:MAG: hypothetical protein ACK4TN_04250, partial [Brevinematales bacterium]
RKKMMPTHFLIISLWLMAKLISRELAYPRAIKKDTRCLSHYNLKIAAFRFKEYLQARKVFSMTTT